MKRGLVISGGGLKGAFAGGLLEYLIKIKKYKWDVMAGTSIGSLVTTVLTYSDIDKLKSLFLDIEYDDIFTNNAYNFNKLNIINIIWRLIRKKTSITNIDKVKAILKNLISEDTYNKNKKILYSISSDYNTGLAKYSKNNDYTYDEFLDLVIASASIPVVFKPIKFKTHYLFDGGVFNNLPLNKVLEEKCDEIDIIILKPKNFDDKTWKPKSMMSVMNKSFELVLRNQLNLQIFIALNNIDYDVKLNFYYDNFDSEVLSLDNIKKLWHSGYNYIKNNKVKNIKSKDLKINMEHFKHFSLKIKK